MSDIKYKLIKKEDELKEVLDFIYKNKYISIDTESDGLYSYEDKLCLMQLETGGFIYIVDTIVVNISSLAPIFQSNDIEKIFHSAYSDISMIKKNVDCNFKNIFDVMIASKYIFKKALSLYTMVEKYFGIKLEKKYQKYNWGKRPILDDALIYASMDVMYLKKIRDIFYSNLIEKKFYEQFKLNCNKIGNVNKKENIFNIERYFQMANTYCLDDIMTSIFIKMVETREELAKKLDLPPFKIISNELLIFITKNYNQIYNAKDLKIFNRCIVRNISWIRKSIEMVLNNEYVYIHKNNTNGFKKNDFYDLKLKILKKWRKQISALKNIPCELIISADDLKKLARYDSLNIDLLKELNIDDYVIKEHGNNLVDFFNSGIKKLFF